MVKADMGFEVIYNGETWTRVTIQPQFKRKTVGLCGIFDKNQANDFTNSDGTYSTTFLVVFIYNTTQL